ncbi:MAG: hypothetical protein JW807_13520 [Spirochaetes bacterium]|nr:hypothetical protein [Spirochaetota bacterium]
MKKRVCAVVCAIVLAGAAAFSSAAKEFRGLVISVSGDSIEVKKGSEEMTLYWAEGTKVTIDGAEADRGSVAVCQKVTARYDVKDGRKELVSLSITRESYCVQ